MKKVLTMVLAVAMLASIACVSASARVIFRDTFETWDPYWWGSMEAPVGRNKPIMLDDGNWVLEGWDDAPVHQGYYEDDEENGGYKASRSTFNTGSFWVDLYTQLVDKEEAGAGLWWKNTWPWRNDGATDGDVYELKYYPATSKIVFTRSFPEATSDEEKTIFVYDDPRARGENMDTMVPITLGMRVEAGKISAFVDGKCIVTYEDSTLGIEYSPVVLVNSGLHAYWDNYCYGDLAELPLKDNPNPNPDSTAAPNPDTTVTPPVTQVKESEVVVTDDKGNAVTDDKGNAVTQIVTEVVTVPSADLNNGPSGNGGAQTGDMAVVVLAVMVIALGSAIVVKKVNEK